MLAVRNLDKGKDAIARIATNSPQADVALQELDLTSLESVRAAAEQLRSDYDRIDLLINNAGVMWTPKSTTKDGFELQFGTNHLGHFAFTGLLMDRLLPVAGSRVVTVSSIGHRLLADIHFDDLQWERATTGSAPTGSPSSPTCCSRTNCSDGWRHSTRRSPRPPTPAARKPSCSATCRRCLGGIFSVVEPLIAQDAASGALPTLRAATDPGVLGGQYYGPDGFGEIQGYPKVVASSDKSHDAELQRRLWAVSEELTGVAYPLG